MTLAENDLDTDITSAPDSQPAAQDTHSDAAGADSSTATDASNINDEAGADSSAAKAQGADAPAPKSSLEAVMAAMQAKRTAGEETAKAGSETSPASDGKPGNEADPKDTDKPTDPDAPPVNMRPENREHWQRLVTEKNAYRERAQNFDNLSNWVQSNGLDYQQVISGLTIMSLIQNDPIKALEAVKPIYDKLMQDAGAVLPADIQQRVDDGRIDEETAQELARQRAEAKLATNRVTVQADQMQRQQSEQSTASIRSAVSAYESQWKATDPDFPTLQPFVHDRVKALMADEGLPDSPDKAVALLKRATADVRKALRERMPARADIKPVVSGGSGKNPGTPQIRTSLDAAKAALGR